MKENEIDRILAELFAGENISEEDRHVLEEWKRENGRNERFEEELQDLKEFSMGLKGRRDNRGVFEQIEKIVKKQREKFLLVRWSVVAAGIVLLMGFASYFMLSSGEREVETLRLANNVKVGTSKAELVLPRGQVIQLDSSSRDILFSGDQVKASSAKNTLVYAVGIDSEIVEFHTIRVPFGAEFNLQLSDNTRVYLNAGSSLRYPVKFTGEIREVFLTGEGYFEVMKDADHPFVVNAGEIDVRVLGTSFNVNAYPDNGTIETTLVEGKVRVEHEEKEQVLDPGMQLVFDRASGKTDARVVDTEVYTSWKDGYYYFKQESLEKIMDVLARWYDLKVFFQNPELKGMEFGGRLKRYENITYLLEKMEETQDVKFIINENTITIKRKTD